ncbi:unnamed protein product [Natator depressus]
MASWLLLSGLSSEAQSSMQDLGPAKASRWGKGFFDRTLGGTPPVLIRYPPPIKFPFSNQLCAFLPEWLRLTSDRWVLNTISQGYTLQFTYSPPNHPCPHFPWGTPRMKLCSSRRRGQLLGLGAIEVVPGEFMGKGCYSHYFLIPKAKEGLRPMLDLQGLNQYMVKLKFCMVSLASSIPFLDPGDWNSALDLQDAYFHIHIFKGHRCFLHFVVGQNHYQFMVLPFGLSTAPRVFTKCMPVVAAYLRRRGAQIFPYLDDWLVKGTSQSQVRDHVALLLSTCTILGLLVNSTNSTLVLVQGIEFIGALLDAVLARASLPPDRFKTLGMSTLRN